MIITIHQSATPNCNH